MTCTERLIDCVYVYPMLFDINHIDYKNSKKKDRAWETIARKLDEPSEVVRKKWKNLRDSYMKFLVANASNSLPEPGKKKYNAWKWSGHMERFKPYLMRSDQTGTKVTSSKTTRQSQDETHEHESYEEKYHPDEEDEPEEHSKNLQVVYEVPEQETLISSVLSDQADFSKQSMKRKLDGETNTDEVLRYFESKASKEMDDIDHLMLGYAKTIKTLSRKRQIAAKRRIGQAVLDLELEEVEENLFDQPSHFSSTC